MFTLVAGAAIQWRRSAPGAALIIAAYYTLIVSVLMNGARLPAQYKSFGFYSGVAEQLAIAAGGLIVGVTDRRLNAALAARLTVVGRLLFGACVTYLVAPTSSTWA